MEDNKETTESRLKQDNRTIYDYMKLVFNYFIIGLAIVACLFVYLLNKVPADKLIIDFSLGDGVISIIATLIGVMVTFVIGYQILNAIQIKEDVEKYQHETKTQINNQNDVINRFKYEISNISVVNEVYDLENQIISTIEKLKTCGIKLESNGISCYDKTYLDLYYKYFNLLHKYSESVKDIDERYLFREFKFDSFENILKNSDTVEYECSNISPFIKERGNVFCFESFDKFNIKNESMIEYCNYVRNEILKKISYSDLNDIKFKEGVF